MGQSEIEGPFLSVPHERFGGYGLVLLFLVRGLLSFQINYPSSTGQFSSSSNLQSTKQIGLLCLAIHNMHGNHALLEVC